MRRLNIHAKENYELVFIHKSKGNKSARENEENTKS